MSTQPKLYSQPTTEFYVILSDGRTPAGAVGPLPTRADATVVYRAIKNAVPGVFAGVATRRPAKGVPIVSERDAWLGGPTLRTLMDRAERVAAHLRPKHEQIEDGDGGRRS